MKTIQKNCVLLALSALVLTPAFAATVTWDPAGGGTSDGAGAWLDAGKWWDGSANIDWTSGDDAIFGNGGAGGAVTLASPTTANSITFNTFTGTYDIGSSGQTLTISNGITHNAGAGAVEMESPVDNGGTDLTVNVLEATPADRNFANVEFRQDISGAGGLIKSGPGSAWIQYTGTLSYTGNTVVNGGILRSQVSGGYLNGLPGNLELNGGVAEAYWGETFTRSLGTSSGEVQLPGGESGFSQHGGNTLTVRLNNNATTPIQWGSATFNPSALVLQSINSNNGSKVVFDNAIDLNGAPREIKVNQGNYTNVYAEMPKVISNSDGVNPSGLTKTGPGMLILTNNGNSYDGPTIVNGGTLALGTGWGNAQSIPGGISSTTGGTSNLEIQNGTVRLAYYMKRPLGTAPTDVQITGGVSGFSHIQSDTYGRITFNDNASTEVVWGSTSFNPSVFVMNEEDDQPNQVVNLQNDVDLNGADRTVATNSTRACDSGRVDANNGFMTTTGGRLTGDIRNSQGTAAGLIKTGPGHLQLTGTNTYDGGTTINEGTVQFTKLVSMPATGTVTVNDSTTLLVNVGGGGEWSTSGTGAGTVDGLINGIGGQGSTVTYVGTTSLGLNLSGSQTYANVLSSAGDLTVTGSGSLELTANNTFTGDVIIDGGATLILSGDNSGASGSVRIINGYLQADPANLPAGGVIFQGGSPANWLGSGSLGLTTGNGNDVFWSGNGGFGATDSALAVTLDSDSTMDWSAGTGGFNGKELQLSSPTSTASVELTNDLDLDGDRTVRVFNNTGSNDDIAILSGDIVESGTRHLYVRGGGTLALTGTNSFGTSNRRLQISDNSVVRAVDGVGLPGTAVLFFDNGVLETSGSFTRDIANASGSVYWNGRGGFAAYGGPLTVNLESGITINWSDTNTGFRNQNPLYLGSDTADNVVTFENNIELRNNRNINVPDNPDTDTDYAVISGIISNGDTNNRNLTKDNNGTLVLEGNNTYTGTTTINGGTLIINSDCSAANGLVDVRNGSGKFLGGTGTLGGNVTLENNTGLTFDLVTAPGSHDKLDVAGSLTFESASVLTLTSTGGTPATGTFTLVTAAGGISGSVPATVNLPVDWTADAPQIVGNDLVINITSVPGGGGDTTAPTWVATWPQVDGITASGATARAQIDEDGTAYYVVLADGAGAPSSAQVVAGNDAGDSPAIASGSIALTASTEGTDAISGLSAGTAYDVYFVAQDDEGTPNLQATPVLVEFTTQTVYSAWADSYSPADVSDPNGDNDSDGRDNLLEFAFGFDPTVADGGTLTLDGGASGTITQNGPPQLFEDGGQYFLRYTRRTDFAAAGLTYTSQFTHALGDPADPFENVTGGSVVGSGTGAGGVALEVIAIEYPHVLPGSGRKARFGRVAVD